MLLDNLNLISAALRIDRSAEASDAGANDDNPPHMVWVMLPRLGRRGRGRLHLSFRERSDEIGAADDADDPVIAGYRHVLYAVDGQQPRDLPELRLLPDGHHRRRNHIAPN